MRNEKTTKKEKSMTKTKPAIRKPSKETMNNSKFKKMEIMDAIRNIKSISELTELQSFISEYKTLLGKSSLSVGSKVWVVQKTKRTKGEVIKMNIKKAVVEMEGMGAYNVPFAMLESR